MNDRRSWNNIYLLLLMVMYSCESIISTKEINEIDQQEQPWSLVDNFHFNDFKWKNPRTFWLRSGWIVDDEPEYLCTGMNIYQYSCHRKENVRINKQGCLEIVATVNERAQYGPRLERFIFNTGKIASNKSWLYGRFEMRAMLPEGRSLRSVFILRPKNPRYKGDWLDNGQINGLVYVQQHTAIIGGLHYKMPDGQTYTGRKLYTQRNITRTFNHYTIEWSNQTIRWLFNDFLFFEHNVSKPFDQEFYLVLQLGVGGPEFDSKSNDVIGPQDAKHWKNNRFIIDYIKVYQRKSSMAAKSSSSSSSSSASFPVWLWWVLPVEIFPFLVMIALNHYYYY